MENVKPILTYPQTERRPGDMVYVFYGAPAVSYYGAQYGLTENGYMIGACRRGDNRHYIEELDTFRGQKRVWLVLTYALPRYRERDTISCATLTLSEGGKTTFLYRHNRRRAAFSCGDIFI